MGLPAVEPPHAAVGLLFTVTLDNAVQGGFDVSVSLADVSATGGAAALASPEDYDNVVADLSFTGTAGETQQFTVATLDDAVLEATETFSVSLAADNPLVSDTDTAIGTLTDNDSADVPGEVAQWGLPPGESMYSVHSPPSGTLSSFSVNSTLVVGQVADQGDFQRAFVLACRFVHTIVLVSYLGCPVLG